ncbi:MAG: sugar ABC transporter ATP-binding protein [Acidobacteria bacterium]|nr:sugar ABC transporter ATP-binding protein [Acidobacteriota bacterium]
MPGLEFRDLHKSFGAVRALDGVSFAVLEGETHACVGENGAGKSTLLKILAGIIRPDRGEIRWRDAPLAVASPREALAAGIGMVYQERPFFPNLSVTANIFAGHEIVGRAGRLDERAMRSRAAALLAQLRVPVSPDVRMEHVSPAIVQLVQVARALAFDCRLLVLDEPTDALTDAEAARLFDVLAGLKARGVTILFVSHRLPEVFRLCDRMTVLRDGRFVATFDRQEASIDQIVRAMVGREPPDRVERERPAAEVRPALSVRELARRPRLNGVSFDVMAGEIVAVFGLVGSGRTELLEAIFGLARLEAGSVDVHGQRLPSGMPAAAIRAGVALVPEERQRQGLFGNLSLADNLALPRAVLAGRAYIRDRDERERSSVLMKALAIKAPHLGATPDRLSGGNQQKVVVAKWLGTGPRVLLLDEPTKGVDVGAKYELHNIIRREASRGMACVIASSDLPEVLALADRILVMRDGRLTGELTGATADETQVMRLAAAQA